MPYSMVQPLRDIPLAFVDTETTGCSAEWGDRVIELGIVRVEGGRIVAEYQQLIDPQRRISLGITALTGISPEMVVGQPRFADQLPAALRLMQGTILVGHNVGFDLSFLCREFARSGCEMTQALGADMQALDTVAIARRRFGRGGNGLQVLASRLGIEPPSAHRALADAQTTLGVFEKLLEPLAGWGTLLCDAMAAQGGAMGLEPTGPRRSVLPLELEEALDLRKPVLMEYLDANQQQTQRVIEPHSIRRYRGEVILVAHCQMRNAQRIFKLDRIVRLTRLLTTGAAE
jgi:DNA polymerase III epsilon subunit family exonuclease